MIHPLEPRRFLSATLIGNLLAVVGTPSEDQITIDSTTLHPAMQPPEDEIVVTINGVSAGSFSDADVQQIRVALLRGNDRIEINTPGDDVTVNGAAGDDTIITGPEKDSLIGGNGNDLLQGGDGDDLLSGGKARDTIMGEGGDDTVIGGKGNDGLSGGDGADHISGGSGIDFADYSDQHDNELIILGNVILPPDWPLTIAGQTPAKPYPLFNPNTLHGCGYLEGDLISSDVENALGGSGNDVIWGSDAANTLYGYAGNDSLYGGAGNNALYGGDGDDHIYAADERNGQPVILAPHQLFPGEDRVHGGSGHDFAEVDERDQLAKIESSEVLPFLSS